ncbi:hypothetical protein JCM8547_008440 [Rhodosporidiobolus lusitaniae]
MQSNSAFDQASDLRTFTFGLDTPSKFLNSTSPTPWSLGGGLTPSLFSSSALSGGARGFTPSIGGATNANGEPNPFELSLSSGTSSRRHSMVGGEGLMPLGGGEGENDFDLLSSTTLSSGRKRALSTPAICTPGGTNFSFLQHAAPAHLAEGFSAGSFSLPPSAKRPRMDSMASSSNESNVDKVFSDSEKKNDGGSPASSLALTPPDSHLSLPSVKEEQPHPLTLDIDVSAPPPSTLPHPLAGSPITASTSQPFSTSFLLSQLEQQRSALLSSGTSAFSQPAPLPIQPLDLSVIKPEPRDDLVSPVAPRPAATRSASKKGKQPELQHGNSSSTASPAPGPAPKRKGGRKKSAPKRKADSGADENKDGAGQEDDEDSIKRKQFLERNRVAACKSRQKKKERTGQLEKLAADLCQRNQSLQATALALRQEAITLRNIMQMHNGCDCEHALGYNVRDANGGGIHIIDRLAGRTLTLDYSQPPSMGTSEDVYSYIDRNEPGPPNIAEVDPLLSGSNQGAVPFMPIASTSAIPVTGMPIQPVGGNAIPVKRAAVAMDSNGPPIASFTPSASVSPVRSSARVSTRSQAAAAGKGVGGIPSLVPVPLVPAYPVDPVLAGGGGGNGFLDIPVAPGVRSTSAPPTTPGGWEAPQPRGDYFAPKVAA